MLGRLFLRRNAVMTKCARLGGVTMFEHADRVAHGVVADVATCRGDDVILGFSAGPLVIVAAVAASFCLGMLYHNREPIGRDMAFLAQIRGRHMFRRFSGCDPIVVTRLTGLIRFYMAA